MQHSLEHSKIDRNSGRMSFMYYVVEISTEVNANQLALCLKTLIQSCCASGVNALVVCLALLLTEPTVTNVSDV